ncbi:SulP family inorganic anion transporter [Rathayibacter sp. YIM 133350]|uniref:SulP family inorganic anion transporter n=1 Tax=Rathayibacter sp. YIM 133350 TaxID=3131992 RepID=UPI00307F1766
MTARNLGTELLAGVTLLAISVPLNIGYAQIAGLPPTAGLYALIVPAVLWAFFVSSRQLIASPDAAASALVASSLVAFAAVGSADYLALAFAQAIAGGVVFVLFAVFKLGFLANFLSRPILVGFVGGLALDILVSQVAKMLGVKIDSGAEFLEKLTQLVASLATVNPFSLAIAVGSIAVLLLGRVWIRAIPWALVVLVVTTLLMVLTPLAAQGVDVLGAVEAGPPTLTWPVLAWSDWLAVIPSAFALTLVGMGEGLLVSKSYGDRRGYPVNLNRDLLAFGVANLASGATGGYTVGSSTSRTAAMDSAGSRTQLPSLVTAVGTLLLVIFGTAVLADIPSPAIGAIVAVAVYPLLGIPDLIRLWRERKFEFAIAAVCFLTALLLGPIAGILVAFVLSLVNLAQRASQPAIDVLGTVENPADAMLPLDAATPLTAPGVVVVRFAAPLFFANAEAFADTLKGAVRNAEPHGVQHLVLDCEAITDVDVTGADAFRRLRTWLDARQVELSLARVRPDLALTLAHFGLVDGLRTFGTNRSAIAALSVGSPEGPDAGAE